MSTFLLLDTSTPVCSVALSHEGEILFSHYELNPEGGHAAQAGILVEQALSCLRSEGLKLSAVGLSAGPGSYTGLRIASSLAKGLCHGFNIPLIAVSTLQMMANGYKAEYQLGENDLLVPMIDARRQEVYTAKFDCEAKRLSEDEARLVSGSVYFDEAMQAGELTYHFFGNGVNKSEGISLGTYACQADFVPQAQYLLPSVAEAFAQGNFVDTAYWKPNYLKEYVAQVSKNKVLA